jgi:hypothetical protein
MNGGLKKIAYFSTVVILIILSYVTLIRYNQKDSVKSITMAILGSERKAEDYFHNEESIIEVNNSLSWYIYLDNKLGESATISIKIKLLDYNASSPNSTSCVASPSQVLIQIEDYIESNDIREIPFNWMVTEVMNVTYTLLITKVEINGQSFDTYVGPNNLNEEFCMVFELWVLDSTTDAYIFTYDSGGEQKCVWNQICFKLEQGNL